MSRWRQPKLRFPQRCGRAPGKGRIRLRTRSSTTRSTLPGYSQTLTWSQLHQRAQVVAGEIASCTSPGDRVAILAPQGLEYIVGFFAAMEAGCVAVPLPVPQFGAHDERASGGPARQRADGAPDNIGRCQRRRCVCSCAARHTAGGDRD